MKVRSDCVKKCTTLVILSLLKTVNSFQNELSDDQMRKSNLDLKYEDHVAILER